MFKYIGFHLAFWFWMILALIALLLYAILSFFSDNLEKIGDFFQKKSSIFDDKIRKVESILNDPYL
jgi:cyanate permease